MGTRPDLPERYDGPLGWKGAAKRYGTVVVKGEEKEQERKEREERAFRENLEAARKKKKGRAKGWVSGKARQNRHVRVQIQRDEEEKRRKELWRKVRKELDVISGWRL